MKDSGLVRMSFSIEEELFQQLEGLIRQSGYSNRSEYIRDLIRKQLTRKLCAASGKVIGTLSVLCDLNHAGIEAKLTAILDKAIPQVLGASRFAVDKNCSTLMITVIGIGSEIRGLVDSIRKLKGVMQAEFNITSPVACSKE